MAVQDIKFGPWTISYDPPPIPCRKSDWSFVHEEYDASWEGEEDGYVDNGLSGYGASVEDCIAQITDIEDDKDMPITADCCPVQTSAAHCLAVTCPHRDASRAALAQAEA